MKTASTLVSSPPARRNRGLALVMIVALLALSTMLLVSLFSVTDSGFRTESALFEQFRARLLGENAVALAQAQLMNATSQQFADGTPKPWTSQPGAIRVHGMDGALETLYKLYTAADMSVGSLQNIADDLPDDWAAQEDAFVDLNAPCRLPGGGLQFPIADPRAKTGDPLTGVEGFDYAEEKGAVGPGGGADAQRLPMPVRWLYILADGSLGTLNAGGQFVPSQPGAAPGRDNPIVGRLAWWVDDETCKVNINTAAEGSFWDVPVADTTQERSLAKHQPTRLEYTRQPGHPAGVCLSSVLLPGRRLYPSGFSSPDGGLLPMDAEDARDLWRMGRQVAVENEDGTSFGGLRETDWKLWWPRTPRSGVRQMRYATTDELLFDGAAPLRAPDRQRQIHAFFNRHPEARERLANSRFFLTADSAAPEVTLFGTPRVALWPVHASTLLNQGATQASPSILADAPPRRDSAYDHKVAAVGVLGGGAYFVQRSEAGNGGNDFEAHADGANKKLFGYLQRLTGRSVPGFARPASGFGSFVEKYGDDRDAILIEMLDYVRACNFGDGQLAQNNQFSILCPGVEHQGFGQVAPLQPRVTGSQSATSNHPQGLGRVLTISEVALVIVCRAEVDASRRIQGSATGPNRSKLRNPGDRELEVGLLVEGFVPGQGWADYRPYANVALVGGAPGAAPDSRAAFPTLRLNGNDLIPASSGTSIESAELPPRGWQGAGGCIGVRGLSKGVLMFRPVVVPAIGGGEVPALAFEGGSADAQQLKIALYDSPGSTDKTDLLQVIPLVMPDIPGTAGIKVPSLPRDLTTYPLANRLKESAEAGKPILSNADIVQSLTPLHGDYRLTATERWAESRDGSIALPVFTPHPQWGKHAQAHTLHDPALPPPGAASQGYIPDLRISSGPAPSDLPGALLSPESAFAFWRGDAWSDATLASALNQLRRDRNRRGECLPGFTGDFDNGIGNTADGPYCNRPDDGNWAAVLASGKVPYFDNVSQTGTSVPPVSLATFSAQRLLPSPVVFGGLPTGARSQVPWQTLLFRPQASHYGSKSPPDHLLLDLFWSPVLEPEPLSVGFETIGKINLNHELLPFRHITRATALHALLKAETITAIPDTAAGTYKNGNSPSDRFRRHIDASRTLRLWGRRVFDTGAVFLTASQVCEHPLVPEGLTSHGEELTMSEVNDFWAVHRLTGDNSKERPYARLYPRLTTRSNTFRVHFITQSVKKARSTAPDTFDSEHDRVTATSQGNAILYRNLDMNDPAIPNYLDATGGASTQTLDKFYHWASGCIQP